MNSSPSKTILVFWYMRLPFSNRLWRSILISTLLKVVDLGLFRTWFWHDFDLIFWFLNISVVSGKKQTISVHSTPSKTIFVLLVHFISSFQSDNTLDYDQILDILWYFRFWRSMFGYSQKKFWRIHFSIPREPQHRQHFFFHVHYTIYCFLGSKLDKNRHLHLFGPFLKSSIK